MDFRVIVSGKQYDIQIKTCHETVAVILPLSEKNAAFLDWHVRKRAIVHSMKHMEVKYMLFVCETRKKAAMRL